MFLRKDLVSLLLDNPMTVSELARTLGEPVRSVRSDLEHLGRSLRDSDLTLRHLPPYCRKCGFELRNAVLGRPGRCPSCRSTWVAESRVLIERA